MSALTTRDALIRSMARTRVSGPAGDLLAGPELGEWIEHLADSLLASGVVVDAARLAHDPDLVRRINHPGNGVQLFAGVHPPEVRDVLDSLAAALSERSPR